MRLFADFGEAAYNAGFQYFDVTGLIGVRSSEGVTNPVPGLYVLANASPPPGAIGVYWNSEDEIVSAYEIFDPRLENLDVAVSSRNAVAPDNAAIGEIKAKTDTLPAQPAGVGSAMTLANGAIGANSFGANAIGAEALAGSAIARIADGIWNEARTGHEEPGTFGFFLDRAVSEVSGGGGGSGLTGPSAVALTFRDANGEAVPNVDFAVSGQGVGRSGTDGVSAFGLPDGSYTVVARATAGVIFPQTALQVNGATDLEIAGLAPAVVVPATPELCSVSGAVIRPDGTPARGVPVEFVLRTPGMAVAGGLVEGRVTEVITDDDGLVAVQLLRNDRITPGGSYYEVSLPNAEPGRPRQNTRVVAKVVLAGAAVELGTVVGAS